MEPVSLPQDARILPDRRQFTVTTLVKGFTHARRKQHRRADECPHAQRDWYHPRLFKLVIGIMLMSVMDAFFTLKLIANGAMEANPVMDYFLQISVSAFVSAKMVMTGGAIVLLTALSSYLFLNRFRMRGFLVITFIGYMVLIAYELFLLNVIVP